MDINFQTHSLHKYSNFILKLVARLHYIAKEHAKSVCDDKKMYVKIYIDLKRLY